MYIHYFSTRIIMLVFLYLYYYALFCLLANCDIGTNVYMSTVLPHYGASFPAKKLYAAHEIKVMPFPTISITCPFMCNFRISLHCPVVSILGIVDECIEIHTIY